MALHQIPYITRHPQYSNLTIAVGGSYTHGKDLPTIGQSIVEAAEGQLKEASMQRHGWQRSENLSIDLQECSAVETSVKSIYLVRPRLQLLDSLSYIKDRRGSPNLIDQSDKTSKACRVRNDQLFVICRYVGRGRRTRRR